jgi:hypothetical protein
MASNDYSYLVCSLYGGERSKVRILSPRPFNCFDDALSGACREGLLHFGRVNRTGPGGLDSVYSIKSIDSGRSGVHARGMVCEKQRDVPVLMGIDRGPGIPCTIRDGGCLGETR